MNKLILVIGSVPAKHYAPIRRQLLIDGHRVKIMRVSSDLWVKFPAATIELVDKLLNGKMAEEDASMAYKSFIPRECSFRDFQEILEWFEHIDETTSALSRAEEYVRAADSLVGDVSGDFHYRDWDGGLRSVQTMAVIVQGMRPSERLRLKQGFEEATARTNNDHMVSAEDDLFQVPQFWHAYRDGQPHQF